MDLGQQVSSHRGTIGAGGWLWYVGGILVLSGIVGFARGAMALITQGDATFLGTGVLGVGIGALLLIVPILRWQQSVEVFERGLVWKRLYGTVTVPREDVRGAEWIRHTSRRGSHDEIVVSLRSGGSYSITGIDAPEQLFANSGIHLIGDGKTVSFVMKRDKAPLLANALYYAEAMSSLLSDLARKVGG